MSAVRLATGLLLLPAALAAQAQDALSTITVNATATVERQPDRARLSLAVESEGSTAQAASQANANLMTRVIAGLREMGLEGSAVRTTSLQIRPQYSRPPNAEPRIAGYTATNTVEVTIDSLDRIGAITDGAIAAGANRVSGLVFELENPESARAAALADAMRMARLDGEAVAAAAGRTLGPPLRVEVEPQSGRPVFSGMSMRGVEMQAADTPVEPGTIEVSATVRVVYRMDDR